MSGTASASVRVRDAAWRGNVEVAAVAIPDEYGDAARLRLLSLWHEGCELSRYGAFTVLRLARPRRAAVHDLPGLALVEHDALLRSFPSNGPTATASATDTIGGVAILFRGTIHRFDAADRVAIDEGELLELSSWQLAPGSPLGAPPRIENALSAPTVDLRAELGVGSATELAALESAPRDGASAEARGETQGSPLTRIVASLASFWHRLRRRSSIADVEDPASDSNPELEVGQNARIAQRLDGAGADTLRGDGSDVRGAVHPGSGEQGGERLQTIQRRSGRLWRWSKRSQRGQRADDDTVASAVDAPPGRLTLWWRRMLWRSLLSSPLGGAVSRRQSRYLTRLLAMFEAGDFDNALRHAIPFSQRSTRRGTASLPAPSIGFPRKRQQLTLSLGVSGGTSGSSIPLGDEAYLEIRGAYLRCFDELVARGRVPEAVFVAVELLGDAETGISLLERDGQLRLAAQVAESYELPSSLVVRQWFLAGDVDRALTIARRSGAFADALARLEPTHPAEAARLRQHWAVTLANAGHFAEAADVLWPLPQHRRQARGWLDLARSGSGINPLRAELRLLCYEPEAGLDSMRRVGEMLRSHSSSALPLRRSLLDEIAELLVRTPRPSPQAQQLLRRLLSQAIRAGLRDRARHGIGPNSAQVDRLINLSRDEALAADKPTDLPQAPAPWPKRRVEVEIDHSRSGRTAIFDVLLLGDGRRLVALGEAGCRLIAATESDNRRPGAPRTVQIDQPAHRLVPNDAGTEVLLLAPRGAFTRVARLDLDALRARHWHDVPLDAFAPSCDGSVWFVATKDGIDAIDMQQSERFHSIWHVALDAGRALALARTPRSLALLTRHLEPGDRGSRDEIWRYELPELVLRRRQEVPDPRPGRAVLCDLHLRADGQLARLELELDAESGRPEQRLAVYRGSDPTFELTLDSARGGEGVLVTGNEAALAPVLHIDRWLCYRCDERLIVAELEHGGRRVEMKLAPGSRCCARIAFQRLLIGDSDGRMLLFDLALGRVLDQGVLDFG
ncbi:MAG: hypothetical protein KC609_04285 [Myxococcales bacterium]|nr:hypothetical protein [Myxococcales bacterium]